MRAEYSVAIATILYFACIFAPGTLAYTLAQSDAHGATAYIVATLRMMRNAS